MHSTHFAAPENGTYDGGSTNDGFNFGSWSSLGSIKVQSAGPNGYSLVLDFPLWLQLTDQLTTFECQTLQSMIQRLPVKLHLIPSTYGAMLRIMRFRPPPIHPGWCAFCRAWRGEYNELGAVGIGGYKIRTFGGSKSAGVKTSTQLMAWS